MNTTPLPTLIGWIKQGDIQNLQKACAEDPLLGRTRTEQGMTLLQFAAYYRNPEVIAVLRKGLGQLDIFEAVMLGETETVEQLLKAEPHAINAFSAEGFTPLGLATYFRQVSVVSYLLEAGADPNVPSRNPLRVTPLHSACATNHFELAELLLKQGADVHAKQMQGVTALHSAAHNGAVDLVKLLLAHGASKAAMTAEGKTPLFMAKEKNAAEVVRLLEGE